MTFSLPRLADVATLKHATAALVEHMSSSTATPPPSTTTAPLTSVYQQQQAVVQQPLQPLQLEHVYTVDSTYYSPESKKVFLSETITDEYVTVTMNIYLHIYTLLCIIHFLFLLL